MRFYNESSIFASCQALRVSVKIYNDYFVMPLRYIIKENHNFLWAYNFDAILTFSFKMLAPPPIILDSASIDDPLNASASALACSYYDRRGSSLTPRQMSEFQLKQQKRGRIRSASVFDEGSSFFPVKWKLFDIFW